MHGSEVKNCRQLGFIAHQCASGTASGTKLSSRQGSIPGKKNKALSCHQLPTITASARQSGSGQILVVTTPWVWRRREHPTRVPARAAARFVTQATKGRVLLCWRAFDQAIHACQRCIHEVYASRGAHHPSLFRQLAHRRD